MGALMMSVAPEPQHDEPHPSVGTPRGGYTAEDLDRLRDSEVRDRQRKRDIYAEAGIKHFWLVEEGKGARVEVWVWNSTRRPTSVPSPASTATT